MGKSDLETDERGFGVDDGINNGNYDPVFQRENTGTQRAVKKFYVMSHTMIIQTNRSVEDLMRVFITRRCTCVPHRISRIRLICAISGDLSPGLVPLITDCM